MNENKKNFLKASSSFLTDKEFSEFIDLSDLSGLISFCKDLLKDVDCKEIKKGIDDPIDGVGFISLRGNVININDVTRINAVSELASNFEIYPQTDGNVCMEFTFYEEVLK